MSTEREPPALTHARDGRAIVVAVDRTRSVRRAKRHSALVRLSRYVLPGAAFAILLFYGAAILEVAGWGEVGPKLEIPKVLPEHLTMNNPRYRGFTKDGGAYDVAAKTAQQDLKLKGLIRLKTVTATLNNPDKSSTKLEANNALYFSLSDKMILQGNIRVSSTTGGWARLTTADIDLKSGIVTSKQPVAVGNATGTINAGNMTIRQKSKEITFAGDVKTKLMPAAGAKASSIADTAATLVPAPAAAPAVTATPAGDAIGRMFAAGKGPIEVDAQRLDVDDVKRVAIYSGKVKVRRDGAVLEAPELRIEYDGSPSGGLTGATPAAAAAAAPPAAKTSIKSIVASGPVVITEGAETRVTAAGAAYDAAASLATLSGGVVIDRAPDTRITGSTAAFNSARDIASIDDKVVVTSGADRRATGDHLTVDNASKTALLTGSEVMVAQGQNVLRGRQLTMDQASGRSVLTAPATDGRGPAGRISAHLVQPTAQGKAKAKPKEDAASADSGGMTLSGFRSDPSQPVDIAADALELNEKDGKAVFRGDVVAVQGEVTIRSAELNAYYSGKAGIGAAVPAAAKEPAAKPAEPVKLTKIQARGKVVVNSKNGQKATGDWADFDTTANTVTLGGDVVLAQGRNVVRGNRLVVDLATGEAVIKTDNSAASDGAGEQPGGGWKAVQKPSRPSAVFFPQEATQNPARKPDGAPGWQSTTSGADNSGQN